MNAVMSFFQNLGAALTTRLERLGLAARFAIQVFMVLVIALKRVTLIIRELYFSGV